MKHTSFVLTVAIATALQAGGTGDAIGAKFLPNGAEWLTFSTVSQKLHEMDVAADAAWRALPDKAAYDKYRKELHSKMMAAMGEWPERTDLNAHTVAVLQKDGYRIEKILFESMPGLYVTGNLFLPDSAGIESPRPAVVMSCGHSNDGKDADGYLRACTIAVKAGFVVFMYDPYEQGERKQFAGKGKMYSTQCHNTIGLKALLLGWSMPMLRTWDAMRAVDYVESRPEIDGSRIGFMGNSGGGTVSSLMTAADWRLKATAPSCFLTSLRALCEGMGPQDAEQNIFGQLAFGLNHTGYVLLPNTKVAVTCKFSDMFPVYGTLDLFDTVRATAAKIGTSKNYTLISSPGPHGWIESTQTASVDWMRAWLDGEKKLRSLDCRKYRSLDVGFDLSRADTGLSPEERGVTKMGSTLELPGSQSIHDIMRKRLASKEKERPVRSKEEIAAIAAKLAGVRNPAETGAEVVSLEEKNISGAKLVQMAFVYPDGLMLPACWIVPEKPDAAKAPVLMAGQRGRAAWEAEVSKCLLEGASVLVADITGYGDIGEPKAIFYKAKDCPEEGVSVMLHLMGESMTGRRATDLLVLAGWLKQKTGMAPELLAQGSVAIPAAHAKAADAGAFSQITVSDAPMSWTQFVKEGDAMQYRYTFVVVNALLHYDWPDLLR